MDPHIAQFSKLLVEKIGKEALSKTCSKGVFVFRSLFLVNPF